MNASQLVVGITTAGPVEVALLGGGHDICANSEKGALESLPALLADVLQRAACTIADVTLIGVCTGPGSFTGLRIGVAFAKTLAQARRLPIVGISTYDAASLYVSSLPIVAVARGKRDHYYARLIAGPTSSPQLIQGSKEAIERAAAELGRPGSPAPIVGADFSVTQPGDGARAVAQLARLAQARGQDLHWTNIAIDYGQRPNAVVNWERRHGVQSS